MLSHINYNFFCWPDASVLYCVALATFCNKNNIKLDYWKRMIPRHFALDLQIPKFPAVLIKRFFDNLNQVEM